MNSSYTERQVRSNNNLFFKKNIVKYSLFYTKLCKMKQFHACPYKHEQKNSNKKVEILKVEHVWNLKKAVLKMC